MSTSAFQSPLVAARRGFHKNKRNGTLLNKLARMLPCLKSFGLFMGCVAEVLVKALRNTNLAVFNTLYAAHVGCKLHFALLTGVRLVESPGKQKVCSSVFMSLMFLIGVFGASAATAQNTQNSGVVYANESVAYTPDQEGA